MKAFIDKADVLIEALPYIQRFKGKKVIIKFGGSVISEEKHTESVLKDVVFMRTVGMQPIVVHGGGKSITMRMRESGITARFIQGLRYTDSKTMEIVQDVLRNEISKNIGDIISQFGAVPAYFNGRDTGTFFCARKTQFMGKEIDLGLVGDIVRVDTEGIVKACESEKVPVIAPIGVDEEGVLYNINADSMAGEMASALNAEKIVFLSDIPGILKDVNDPKSMISSLRKKDVDILIRQGVIHGGMIPKIDSCLKSLEAGARKTHIIDGRLSHSLLLEIFTDKGVGTEIVRDNY
ncbi:MAG: acetylglutamate kinase [Candidatus Aureabacteria bacterium]|nr:acetylglutamate kinase [Candidatus Auribacterota bacterium]